MVDEWCHLCGCALTFGCVKCKSQIYSYVSHHQRIDASFDAPSGGEDAPTAPMDQPLPTSKRGDASAHGFWQHSHTFIFDVCITDTQSCSYWKDYQKVLAQQEKEKKNQYLHPRLEMWKDFTPLVYSVDGIAGREAKNAVKHLAYHLLEKWRKPLS